MRRGEWTLDGRVHRLLLATTASTLGLMLLGIYTAAIGAGLTCDGRWPLCDGAVFGLFPANWTSFVEWFHRLVAMITGVLILGSAIASWRTQQSRPVVAALGLAVVLLPIQIWAGAQTVLTYEIVMLTAHFLIALPIFTAVLLATAWLVAPQSVDRRTLSLTSGVGLVALVPFLLLSPRLLFVHTGRVQAVYYGLGLLVFSSLVLVVALVHRNPTLAGRVRWVVTSIGALLAIVLVTKLLVGRLYYTPELQAIDWLASGVLVVGLGVLFLVLRRERRPISRKSAI